MNNDEQVSNSDKKNNRSDHNRPSGDPNIGLGNHVDDPKSGTLSDRAGDEEFDNDERSGYDGEHVSEDDDDM
ncbi:MAG TPA: hypothetical protein VF581_12130 [Flavobacterium sp.]|jgi:hypothetical protein